MTEPWLYILIEETTRELQSRLLIAALAAREGFRTVIGPQWFLWNRFRELDPGIVLFKGYNGVQIRNMRVAKAAGHAVAAIDEESLGIASEQEILRQAGAECGRHCDLILAQGAFQAECLERSAGVDRSRIVVTGSPRADLLAPALAGPIRRDAAALRARHGDYLLINTNFGSVNPEREDTLGAFEMFERAGVIDRSNERDVDDFIRWCTWEGANLDAVLSVIGRLRSGGLPWRIIVRPHPTEGLRRWQAAFNGANDVLVSREGDHVAWTAGARALLHTSCTTGLEAHLLGTPAISLRPPGFDWGDHYLANLVNRTVTSADEAAAAVQGLATGTWSGEEGASARSGALNRHLLVEGDCLASERIARALARLPVAAMPERGATAHGAQALVEGDAPENKIDLGRLEAESVRAALRELCATLPSVPVPHVAQQAAGIVEIRASTMRKAA